MVAPGPAVSASVPVTLRVIPWGDRLYLSTDQELQCFCRAGLNLPLPPNLSYAIGGAFLRESDRAKRRWGLPRLPLGVWMKFLLDELKTRNDDGTPRLRLESPVAREQRLSE